MRGTNFWWAAGGILLLSVALADSACKVTSCSHATELCDSNKGFEEVYRENCTGSEGAASYCCEIGSMEATLAATLGAEPHEFPYMAFYDGKCGSTIYNEYYLITAAHCIVDDDTHKVQKLSSKTVVKVGRNIEDSPMPENDYRVVEAIPHPEYSGLVGHPELLKGEDARLFNDIAIVKVDRPIKFGRNVKPLPIAPEGFEITDSIDQTAVILGWGKNDLREPSGHLQKANVIIRDENVCFGDGAELDNYSDVHSQLLCLGGNREGKYSPTADEGDSGGPAVCRDDTGHAVLCGVTSMADIACGDNGAECIPSIYADVDYFREWIEETAGEQREEDLFKVQLYGEVINANDYPHQVRITSPGEKPCGGTLIAQDTVVTAARCVRDLNSKTRKSPSKFKVWVGVTDVSEDESKWKYVSVKDIKIRKGFKIIGPSLKVIKAQKERVTYSDQLHENDLAVLMLKEKVDIKSSKLPRLPKKGETFIGSVVAVEFAFPRDTNTGGEMRKRDFTILDKEQCQRRLNRLENLGKNVILDDNTLCGVEVHSGGSQCDRELGGGLICKGEDGKDVLCGVQKFRLCESALPSIFENLATAIDFVQSTRKQ